MSDGQAVTAMDKATRLDLLRQRLVDGGTVRIADMAGDLGTSEMTIRRDLDTLEALGEAQRVRGGARVVGGSGFAVRSGRNMQAKVAIATKLVGVAPDTGTIAIDSSTTMAMLANLLTSARDLLVVTNGMQAFEALAGRRGVRAVLCGGELDCDTGSLVGPVAEATVANFRFDAVFVSAAAVDVVDGAFEHTLGEASMVRAFARQADRVVVGVDTAKLAQGGAVRSLQWSEVSLVATELTPGSPRLAGLSQVTELR